MLSQYGSIEFQLLVRGWGGEGRGGVIDSGVPELDRVLANSCHCFPRVCLVKFFDLKIYRTNTDESIQVSKNKTKKLSVIVCHCIKCGLLGCFFFYITII